MGSNQKCMVKQNNEENMEAKNNLTYIWAIWLLEIWFGYLNFGISSNMLTQPLSKHYKIIILAYIVILVVLIRLGYYTIFRSINMSCIELLWMLADPHFGDFKSLTMMMSTSGTMKDIYLFKQYINSILLFICINNQDYLNRA